MVKSPVKRKDAKVSGAISRLKKLRANKRNDLTWHHEVGQLVAQLVPEKRTLRANKMPELLKQLGIDLKNENERVNTQLRLYANRKFALTYSEAELADLQPLKYGHIEILVGIKDKKRRHKFQKQCRVHGWTVHELRASIQEKCGKQSRGGMKFKVGKSIGPRATLKQLLWFQGFWQNKIAPTLKENLELLAEPLSQQHNEELTELFDGACAALDKLHAAVEDARTKLEQVKKKVRKMASKPVKRGRTARR